MMKDKDKKLGGDNFEDKQYEDHHEHANIEAVHALIDNAKLRAVAEGREILTATDMLKEVVIMEQQGGRAMPRPMGPMMMMAQMQVQKASARIFEMLDIDVNKLFPDLKERKIDKVKDGLRKGAQEFAIVATTFVEELDKELPGAKAYLLGKVAEAVAGPARPSDSHVASLNGGGGGGKASMQRDGRV